MASSSVTVVNASATAVLLLPTRTIRSACTIVNDSTWLLLVKFGSAPTATDYKYKLGPLTNSAPYTLELAKDIYDRIWVENIYGIWVTVTGDAINGRALCTEEY